MSDDYAPTTEEVETHWADVGFAGDRASFRRWLAEHDRRVAARAWGEGQKSGMRYTDRMRAAYDRMRAAYELGRPELPGLPSSNPYRAAPNE